MKTTKKSVAKKRIDDDLLPYYDLDYSKAKPNRFAGQSTSQTVVMLDVELSKIFRTEEEVTNALRLLVQAMPARNGGRRKKIAAR